MLQPKDSRSVELVDLHAVAQVSISSDRSPRDRNTVVIGPAVQLHFEIAIGKPAGPAMPRRLELHLGETRRYLSRIDRNADALARGALRWDLRADQANNW